MRCPWPAQCSTPSTSGWMPPPSFILEHGEASVVIVDKEFGPVTEQALAQLSVKPQVIHIDDSTYQDGKLLGMTATKIW